LCRPMLEYKVPLHRLVWQSFTWEMFRLFVCWSGVGWPGLVAGSGEAGGQGGPQGTASSSSVVEVGGCGGGGLDFVWGGPIWQGLRHG
jgi:hypothetical protein